MLKDFLTSLHHDEELLAKILVTAGLLDVNATEERRATVFAKIRSDLEAAGVEAPAAVAPAEQG